MEGGEDTPGTPTLLLYGLQLSGMSAGHSVGMHTLISQPPPAAGVTASSVCDVEAPSGDPQVEIVLPVYNEERVLRGSVEPLHSFLARQTPWSFQVTVADNASSDDTRRIGELLARDFERVTYVRLERKGRGRALRAAWGASRADVVAYMDVDLSTDLAALPKLVAPLLENQADVTIGTRLAPGASAAQGRDRSRAHPACTRPATRRR
jgi:cellulose synthase/poly-beta-1,6-N-acetylglucosamine synthase-like glycosyltransferase